MISDLNMDNDIIVYCAARYGEKICIQLLSLGYNIACFCDNAKKNKGISLLGIPVYNYKQCQEKYPKAVYVVANSNKSNALEICAELEIDGYMKNISYYNAAEWEMQGKELPEIRGAVRDVLSDKTLILYGNKLLCDIFKKWITESVDAYICPSKDKIAECRNKYPKAIWIPLEFGGPFFNDLEKTEELLKMLSDNDINSFSRFFLYYMIFCEEKSSSSKNVLKALGCDVNVKKVVFLKSVPFSGATFINPIMDFHPNIMYLGMNALCMDIWRVVKMMSGVSNDEKIDVLMDILKEEFEKDHRCSFSLREYRQILGKYIQPQHIYFEKDLFLILHLAQYELLHGAAPDGELIIYMDIHENAIKMRDTTCLWLEGMGFEVILLEMIRCTYKRLGSGLKLHFRNAPDVNRILGTLDMVSGETLEKTEERYQIIRIRFEDLKMHPKEILGKLCEILEIPWSDTFLEGTSCGKPYVFYSGEQTTRGFDLKPVYHTYDEYFDEFDKFRLDMIFREKNKAYGYSYVNEKKYADMLLKMHELFKIPFKFEEYITFKSETDRKRFRNKMQMLCSQLLFLEANKEKYNEHFKFGNYLKVEEK